MHDSAIWATATRHDITRHDDSPVQFEFVSCPIAPLLTIGQMIQSCRALSAGKTSTPSMVSQARATPQLDMSCM